MHLFAEVPYPNVALTQFNYTVGIKVKGYLYLPSSLMVVCHIQTHTNLQAPSPPLKVTQPTH
jgi:hypothetical protein